MTRESLRQYGWVLFRRTQLCLTRAGRTYSDLDQRLCRSTRRQLYRFTRWWMLRAFKSDPPRPLHLVVNRCSKAKPRTPDMHKRRLNHLLCFVLIALLLQGSSRGEVIPIVRESQGGEDLRRLNTLLSLLRPDEVFFFSAYPLSKAGLEGAPDLNVVLEAAFVTAGNRVRFVPAEALPAVLQIHSNTPIYAVRGG